MKHNPLVSVIVAVYNMKEHIRQCIESVLRQSMTDLELILVDDVSTDGTNWTQYADQTKGRVRTTPRIDEGVARAKYIRITLADCESLNRNYGSKNLKDPSRWRELPRYGIFEFRAYAYVTE